MGEIRGEEGRTLFQVMSTGHTTYTTFHADSVGEVLKRFTTEPINVSKTMFTALDLVSIQTSTRVNGNKVRRNKTLTEINRYDAENDEINVQDVYQWQAESDEFLQMTDSNTLEEIKFDRGWSQQTIDEEIFTRQAVLAYLLKNGLNTYTQVAATFQAFINDPETILTLMANDGLEDSLEDLREMGSVLIDIDPEKEEMVPRPEASEEMLDHTGEILEEAEDRLFEQYRGEDAEGIAAALMIEKQGDVAAEPGRGEELRELTDGTDAGATTDAEPSADTADTEPSADTADTEPSAESGKESPSKFGMADRADSEQETGGGFGDSGPFDGDLGFGDGADDGDFSDGATADLGQDPADPPAGSEPSGIDPDSVLDESDIEFTRDGQDETNVLGESTATGDEDAALFGGDEAGDSFGVADSAGSSDTEAFGQSVDTDEPADLSGDSQPTPQETPSESTTDQSADGSRPDQTDVGNADDGEPASESPDQDGPADGDESAAENEEVTEEVTSEESTAADGPADTGEMDSTEAAVDPEEAIDVEGLTEEIADPEETSEEETAEEETVEEETVEEETVEEETAEEEASDDTEWDFGVEGAE
jgi:flagellar protein FlaI